MNQAQQSWLATLLILFGSLPLIACEEEPETSINPRRTRRFVNQSTQNAVSVERYQVMGQGPREAPDWIKELDVKVLRIHSRENPKGFRKGNTFEPQSIWIERRESGWYMVLNEIKLKYPQQLALEGERVELPLGPEVTKQLKVKRSLEESVAQWLLPADPFVIGKTRAWNSENHFALELLGWSLKPYDRKQGAFQVAGSASGRVMAHFVDSRGDEGWFMGRFEEIPVRYMGDPAVWTQP